MKRQIFSGPLLILVFVAGCATVSNGISAVRGGNDTAAAVDVTDPCGAQGYTSLLGAQLAAVTLPADLNDRVVRPGEVVTTDFDQTRLNLELDDAGIIIGLSCG